MSASLDASFLDGIKEDLCKTPVVAIRGELWSEYFALKLSDGGFAGDQSTCLNNNIYREHGELYTPDITW